MLKKYVLAGFILTLCAAGVLFSQSPNITEKPTTSAPSDAKPDAKPEPKPDLISIKDFNPQATGDPRFFVSNFSLDRRPAPDGRGEILDLYFDVANNTSQPVELYAWVMAFYETNAVDQDERRIIPYPVWRAETPDRRTFLTRYIAISPQNVPTDRIWSPEDPDFKRTQYTLERMRSAIGSMKPVSEVYPPYWKYVAYVSRYPTKGLLFKLRGDQGPGQHETLQTNFVPPTPEEKRTKIFKNIPSHTYTLEHTRRKTYFRTHHYTAYRADFYFFNTVAILFFDAKKAAAAEEQAGRQLQPGEAAINPMVFYRTIRLDRKMRIY